MPQFEYTHPVLALAEVGTASPWTIDSYQNALVAQVSTVTGTAPAAGTYTFEISGDEGTFATSVTMAGGETPTQFAAAIVAAMDADADLLNITTQVAALGVVTISFIYPGRDYTITITADPGPDLSTALVTAAGGTFMPLGVGVVPGATAGEAALPGAASVDADFLGVFVNATIDAKVNDGAGFATVDGVDPGETLSVMRIGDTVVATEDAVAFNGQVFMRIQNAGAGQTLGGFRSDADGGDAIAITGARFRSATAGAGLARVSLNRV